MNRIKQLRKNKGITQGELCKKLNISQGTLSTWETGFHEPSLQDLINLSYALNTSVDIIIGKDTKDLVIITRDELKKLREANKEAGKILSSIEKNNPYTGKQININGNNNSIKIDNENAKIDIK